MKGIFIVTTLILWAVRAHSNLPWQPEMDPGLTSTGLACLAGSLLVFLGRGKR
jgi:hypothetical protein